MSSYKRTYLSAQELATNHSGAMPIRLQATISGGDHLLWYAATFGESDLGVVVIAFVMSTT
jgi:hypothetical protein